MKKKLFKSVKKIVSLALVATLLLYSAVLEVQAAEFVAESDEKVVQLDTVVNENHDDMGQTQNVRTMLYNCVITVFCSSNGLLAEMTTDCSKMSSAIGVKDISIEKKVWYGWKEVAVSSGGEVSNSSTFAGSVLYTDAEYDATYRICCTHYATYGDEYVEVVNQTDGFQFTY